MILVITATANFALLHTGLFSSSLVLIAYTWIIYKVTYRKCIYKQFMDYALQHNQPAITTGSYAHFTLT